MNNDLTRDSELRRLARQINKREEDLQELVAGATSSASQAISEAILQGQDLIAAKARVPHGMWIDWLKCNCPKSVIMAQRYMRIASNIQKINEANSLRAALALIETDVDPNKPEPRQWPPYIEAIGRIGKFVDYIERHPCEQWPVEGREKLKQELLPVATRLWPEKFAV